MKKIILGTTAIVASAAIGAGVTCAVVVPKAFKAKKGLKSFVSSGGSYNSLANKEKVNIVSIGDSETAGYNGLMGEDYLSYSDFLAASFKNAGKLGHYHNFANSGQRLSDIKRSLFESPDKVRQLKDADLVTLTIGANDILAYVKFLTLPYGDIFDLTDATGSVSDLASIEGVTKNGKTTKKIKMEDNDTIIDSNTVSQLWRRTFQTDHPEGENDFENRNQIFGDSPANPLSKEASKDVYLKTISDLKELIKGNNQYLINLDTDWYPKIFELVKREMATLVRDLHEAAPKAQIEILGHAFPFEQVDTSVIDSTKPEINNTTIRDNFNRLLSSMESGAKSSLGKNKFVTFTKVDDIPTFKKAIKKVDYSTDEKFIESFSQNAMPNISDIHPSTYGHELIGDYLFEKLGKENGLTKEQITKFEQHSFPSSSVDNPVTKMYDESKWTRIDENPVLIEGIKDQLMGFNGLTNISNSLGGADSETSKLVAKILETATSPSNGSFTIADFLNVMPTDIHKKIIDTLKESLQKYWNLVSVFFPGSKDLSELLGISDKNPFGLDYKINILADKAANNSGYLPGKLGGLVSVVEGARDMIETSRVVCYELENGVKDPTVSDYEQYQKSHWGLIYVFQKIMYIKSNMANFSSLL